MHASGIVSPSLIVNAVYTVHFTTGGSLKVFIHDIGIAHKVVLVFVVFLAITFAGLITSRKHS